MHALVPRLSDTMGHLHSSIGIDAVTGAFKTALARVPSEPAAYVGATCQVRVQPTPVITIHGDNSAVYPDHCAFVI